MLEKKQAIIAKIITRVINCCFLDWINILLCKFMKKYKFDKLRLYSLLKSRAKNVCSSDT